jgi:hypothetical protein
VRVGDNAIFTLEGGTIKNNTATNSSGGGVRIDRDTIFTMEGGTISGNKADNDCGGGVDIDRNANFILAGGEISGNRAKGGGGVRLCDNSNFTMQGGTISGNTATEWQGGGVRVDRDANFTMQGGTISNNTSTNGGGGVKIEENAIFAMERGTISDNTSNASGGAVEVHRGTFTMTNGEISGNTAENNGGGVFVNEDATFTLEGGTISGNTANYYGGGVDVWRGTFTKKGGKINGDTDATHTPGSAENTALGGYGHAVDLSGGRWRNATADTGVKLYAKYKDDSWTYNDASGGGVGDTTANWDSEEDDDRFVAVRWIWTYSAAEVGEPVALNGPRSGVGPENASNKTITWTVKDAGSTGATISGNVLTVTALGDVVVTGTVANGTAVGTPFIQDRSIRVTGPLVTHGDFVTREIQGGVELAQYRGSGPNVVVPNDLGITMLGPVSLAAETITSVVVPEGVTKIDEAFWDSYSLTSITVLAETPPIGGDSLFMGDGKNLPLLTAIYVPAASVNAYKDANGWKKHADIIQAIPAP